MRLITLILLFFSASLVFGQSSSIQTVDIKTKIWCDHCDECESCGPHIFFSLKSQKGIKKIEVKSELNIISVKYDSDKLSLSEIEESIALAGFDANERKADPDAYNKLDACCKRH